MFLARISIQQPVFATMMMVAIVVLGIVAWSRLPVDLLPSVDLPTVIVSTNFDGASALAVEQQVSRPIEESIGAISGIKKISSQSSTGNSLVIAEFTLETPSRAAADEVRDRISRLQDVLPDGADRPLVTRFNPQDAPIMSLAAFSADISISRMTEIVDTTIVPRLRRVPGVGQVTLVGGSEDQVRIQPDPVKLQSFGIPIPSLIEAIQRATRDSAIGSVVSSTRERSITVSVQPGSVREFADIVIAQDSAGRAVRLSEVADVMEAGADPKSKAWFNGKPALGLDIVKLEGANTVQVAKGVERALEQLRKEDALRDIGMVVSQDSSRTIVGQIGDVQRTIIEGGALTIVIVLLFLNSWRSTIITALTLPVAVIGTFAAIAVLGFSLNLMTMLALSICIGILIDDAIVVRENISRHAAMGKDRKQAALDGTTEIGLAVLATTFSIVAVFLPVAFMGGVIGRFFLQFGVTVSVAVMISLFVSFTLDPMLSSVWADQPNGKRKGRLQALLDRFDKAFERIAHGYGGMVGWCLDHRGATSLGVLVLFAASLCLIPRIGMEFVPKSDQGMVAVGLTLPEGSSVDYTAAKIRQTEDILREYPDIRDLYSTVNSGDGANTNEARIAASMVAPEKRSMTSVAIAPKLREALSPVAGTRIEVGQPGEVSGAQAKTIQISVLGGDLTILEEISRDMMAKLGKIAGVIDLESSADKKRPMLMVRLRADEAADLGISTATIERNLRPLVAGEKLTSWAHGGDESRYVAIRLPETGRRTVEDLAQIPIPIERGSKTGPAATVPLSQVADITETLAPKTIIRRDGDREVRLSANLNGRPLGDVVRDIQALISAETMPAGYRMTIGGEADDMAESFGYAAQALLLAIVFIYLILASQFGSFVQPIAIMTSLPLSISGVLIGLLVTGSTINIFSVIGVIMLMGLVTKNAILLVDHANKRRREGASMRQGLIDAGIVRFRPIVMTTSAMIIGMMPLALGFGEGGQERASMAHAVIGGLLSSTALTLVFVPVALSLIESCRTMPALRKSGSAAGPMKDAAE
ncbi:efflux RND transporter permease subunit [Rhizobium multihospitium]|uniref:Nodulation-related efflux transporter NolG n=1 Tax=Rhizobium multihospitium TaxID=410764 RepID=A0A1C3XF27_9HYPH|nr:efflux RND transporter permease subunit [Rhizobium multihospitium]SCB50848.1 nodulation-related efflux transporter NolG [Rhizobium multihospitium]